MSQEPHPPRRLDSVVAFMMPSISISRHSRSRSRSRSHSRHPSSDMEQTALLMPNDPQMTRQYSSSDGMTSALPSPRSEDNLVNLAPAAMEFSIVHPRSPQPPEGTEAVAPPPAAVKITLIEGGGVEVVGRVQRHSAEELWPRFQQIGMSFTQFASGLEALANVRCLTTFFSGLNRYFAKKAKANLILEQSVDLIQALITCMVMTLVLWFDWGKRINLSIDETRDFWDLVTDSFLPHPFVGLRDHWFSFRGALVLLTASILISAALSFHRLMCDLRHYRLYHFTFQLLHAMDNRISEERFEMLNWEDVVAQALVKLQQNVTIGDLGIAQSQWQIRRRIHWVNNYMSALVRCPEFSWLSHQMSWTLDWSLRRMLKTMLGLEHLYFTDGAYESGKAARKFRKFCIKMGVLSLVECPFMILYFLIKGIFENFARLVRHPSDFLGRAWTSRAKWLFRSYDEDQDELNARLLEASKLAYDYLAQTPKRTVHIVARLLTFLFGVFASLALMLIGWIMIQEPTWQKGSDLVSSFKVWNDYNLWWLWGTLTTLAWMAYQFTPQFLDYSYTPLHPEGKMREVAAKTRYFPDRWVNRCSSQTVRKEFTSLFVPRWKILLWELCSVVVTPFILLVYLPFFRAEDFIRFLMFNTVKYRDSVAVLICADYSSSLHFSNLSDQVFHAHHHVRGRASQQLRKSLAMPCPSDVSLQYYQFPPAPSTSASVTGLGSVHPSGPGADPDVPEQKEPRAEFSPNMA